MKIDGSCHCGHIIYRAEVDPDRVFVCHCTDCQSITGSAFRWAAHIPEENFELLSGTPKTHVKTAASGATNHQVFCPECASPLYSTSFGDGPKPSRRCSARRPLGGTKSCPRKHHGRLFWRSGA